MHIHCVTNEAQTQRPAQWIVATVARSEMNGDFYVTGRNLNDDSTFCWHISPKFGLDGFDFAGAVWTDDARSWAARRWAGLTFPGL